MTQQEQGIISYIIEALQPHQLENPEAAIAMLEKVTDAVVADLEQTLIYFQYSRPALKLVSTN